MPNLKSVKFFFALLSLTILTSQVHAQGQASLGIATWTGAKSSEWNNPANWNTGKVPDETTSTIIPTGTPNMPVAGSQYYPFSNTANIDVKPGATVTVPLNRTLNVYGNFLNTDESRYQMLGRINFAGSNQQIPGFSYNSITISGGGVKTLTGNVTVTGMFLLIRGLVKTDENHMLTLCANAMISVGYETAFIDGPLTRITASTHVYSFPVGDDGAVKNISVMPNDETTSAYTVRFRHAATPASGRFACTNLLGNRVNEFYEVKKAVGSTDARLEVPYEALSDAGAWSNHKLPGEEQSVAIIVNRGSNWKYTGDASQGFSAIENIPANTDGNLGGQVTVTSALYSFGYGYSKIDSLELISFRGVLQNVNSLFTWSVRQGNDAVFTQLEHSGDGFSFQPIDSVTTGYGAENHFDQALTSGAHYFRLKMQDKAGNILYSKNIRMELPAFQTIVKGLRATMLHTDGYLDIESAGNQPVSIALFDMSGRVINKLSTSVMTGKNCIHFDAMMITPGMYNLYVQTSDGVKATLRFMKD